MISTQTLRTTAIKELVFSAFFTAMAVTSPMLVHFFAGTEGGRTYLPMPFFVLLAGLVLGWRASLATALMSPIVSFLISGMPAASILPFVVVQSIAYGVVAGIAGRKYHAITAILFAVAAGWATIGLFLFAFSKMDAWLYVLQGLKTGLLGVILQLILLPQIAAFTKKHLGNENEA